MGLQVWLPLNGNLDNQGLADVSVINNGATVDTGGKIGSCYNFNGSGYVQGTTDFSNFSDMVSLSMWVNLKASAGYQELLTIGVNSAWVGIRCSLIINSASLLRFSISDGVKSSQNTYYVGNIGTNTWVHVVGVYNYGEVTTYLNGIKTNTYTATITPKFSDITKFGIGANPNGSEKATCLINDVRIYNHALSPREVAEIAKGLVCHYPLSGPTPEQLFGEVTEDNTIYSIRQSPDKHGAYDSIVGASVGWNQLMNPRNITFNNVTFSVSNGKYTISGTCNNSGGRMYKIADEIEIVANHKYLVKTTINMSGISLILSKRTDGNTYTGSGLTTNRSANIINPTFSGTCLLGANLTSGTTYDTNGYINLYDLTQMFGTAIADRAYTLEQSSAGSGVTWLKSQGFFTQDYYPYNPGQIKSVEGLVKREVVGFNQWDEEWEAGGINTQGYPVPSDHQIRSKNYSPCIGNAEYYLRTSKTDRGTNNRYYLAILWYDAEKKFISFIYANNMTTVSPENAAYFKIATNSSTVIYGATYNHDICINLSNLAKNGTYEPYISHTYSFTNPPTLRGVYKLDSNNNIYADGDIWDSNGSVGRRYGIVDLGTRATYMSTWSTVTDENYFGVGVPISDMTSERTYHMIVSRIFGSNSTYVTTTPNLYAVGGSIYICVPVSLLSERSLNAAKNYFTNNQIFVVYPLATPTAETSTTFTNPQIIEPYGTEAYSFTGLIPPGHTTKYVDVGFEGGNYTYDEALTNMGMTDNIEYDVSGYVHNAVRNNITYSSDSPRYNGSYVLNGTNTCYIESASLPSETQSVSFWIKAGTVTNSSVVFADYGSKIAFGFNGNNTTYIVCDLVSSSSSYSTGTRCVAGDNWKSDDWNHIVVIRLTSSPSYTFKTYLNGVLLENSSTNFWTHTTNNFTIGRRSSGSPFNGQISDFRAYATQLSEDDILELYHTPISLSSNGSLLTQGEIVES